MLLKTIFSIAFTAIFIFSHAQDSSKTDLRVFSKVEIEASFPGGANGWKEYLVANVNPNTPIDNGAPAGSYQVMVKFIVRRPPRL